MSNEDEIKKWKKDREVIRNLFANLDFFQLIDVGRDLSAMLEYRAKQLNTMLDHGEFNKMMKNVNHLMENFNCDGMESSG